MWVETVSRRRQRISRVLDSHDGRTLLAQIMVIPIQYGSDRKHWPKGIPKKYDKLHRQLVAFEKRVITKPKIRIDVASAS